jgi:hypothetical protein
MQPVRRQRGEGPVAAAPSGQGLLRYSLTSPAKIFA